MKLYDSDNQDQYITNVLDQNNSVLSILQIESAADERHSTSLMWVSLY